MVLTRIVVGLAADVGRPPRRREECGRCYCGVGFPFGSFFFYFCWIVGVAVAVVAVAVVLRLRLLAAVRDHPLQRVL